MFLKTILKNIFQSGKLFQRHLNRVTYLALKANAKENIKRKRKREENDVLTTAY